MLAPHTQSSATHRSSSVKSKATFAASPVIRVEEEAASHHEPPERRRLLVVGGPDVNLRIELMQALADRYHVVAAGSEPRLAADFEKAGFAYHHYPLARGINPASDLQTLRILEGLIRATKPAIVHTFATKPSVWGRIAAHRAGVPAIIGTIPGLGSLYTYRSLASSLTRRCYESLQKYAARCSHMTVFQNQVDLEYFREAGIVAEDRSMLVPGSGVATSFYDPAAVPEEERQRIARELGLTSDSIVVTMVGRVIRSKGVMEFAAAAAAIRAVVPNTTFVLVGPDDTTAIDALTDDERRMLSASVRWLGYRSDIRAILSVTNIFALPSYYREGMPRALLEAASMAIPLVTAHAPGCSDVVVDGECGFLVPPRSTEALTSAIERLVRDADLRARLGAAARARVQQKFDLSIVADMTARLYEQVLGSHHQGGTEARGRRRRRPVAEANSGLASQRFTA